MDFLFNLISLLANLFSIEDHFKKDNDAKTVINNNYNFYVNNSSSNIDPISRNINMSDRSSLLLLFFVLVFTLIVQLLLTKTLNFIYPNLTWLRRFEKGTILLNIILALLVITILVIRIIHFKKKFFLYEKYLHIIFLSLALCSFLYHHSHMNHQFPVVKFPRQYPFCHFSLYLQSLLFSFSRIAFIITQFVHIVIYQIN